MTTEPQPRACPRCFAPLRATESPEGLCPKCLLAVGMGEDAVIRTGTGAPVPAPPTVDDLNPHFEGLDVLSLIGRGGAGAVYRATQRDLGRQVALKVLLLDPNVDPSFGERFVREARAMASLNHPNIAAVHDAGRSGPYWFLVMEFVDGPNLRQVIQSRDMTPTDSLDVVRQICDALEYAHAEGVVHRDIKPENVLIDRRGRVKLVDFGLAKLLGADAAGGATLTRSAQVMGTWHYMAPEQLRRPLEVDHRADIYSLGVVLYELLTGEVPQGRYSPASVRARTDRRLDAIVDRALEQDPTRRYQEASGVREDVARVQSGPAAVSSAREESSVAAAHRDGPREDPVPPAKLPGRTKRRHTKRQRKPVGVFGGCLLAAMLFFIAFLLLSMFMWLASAEPGGGFERSIQATAPPRPLRPTTRLDRPAVGVAATLNGLYPGIDVNPAAQRAWTTYAAHVRAATSTQVFRSPDRAWLQISISPFAEERARLIDAALRPGGRGHDSRTEAEYRSRLTRPDRFPFGEGWHVLEVELLDDGDLYVKWNGSAYAQTVSIGETGDPVLVPVMEHAKSSFDLKRALRSGLALPWTLEQIGATYAPGKALELLKPWWLHQRALRRRYRTFVPLQSGSSRALSFSGYSSEFVQSLAELESALLEAVGDREGRRLQADLDWDALAPAGYADRTLIALEQKNGIEIVRVQQDEDEPREFLADDAPWYLLESIQALRGWSGNSSGK